MIKIILIICAALVFVSCSGGSDKVIKYGFEEEIILATGENEVALTEELTNEYLEKCVPSDAIIPINKAFRGENIFYIGLAVMSGNDKIKNQIESDSTFTLINSKEITIDDCTAITFLLEKSDNYLNCLHYKVASTNSSFWIVEQLDDSAAAESNFEKDILKNKIKRFIDE
jgi:hypothetical protein